MAENIGNIFIGRGGNDITLAGKPLIIEYCNGAATAVASFEVTDSKNT